MKVSDIMTKDVVKISQEESVEVAARTLTHYNIGALPVCDAQGKLCGMVTDRDLVIRCMAANKLASDTTVRQVMTNQLISVEPGADVTEAAQLMGSKQIRRLPVVEQGRLCGMISLGDIAGEKKTVGQAASALTDITSGIRRG